MKKFCLLIFVLLIYFCVTTVVESKVLIPNDAIRIRIIPNSNTKKDQQIKQNVKSTLQNSLFQLLKDAKNEKEANKIIKINLSMINNQITKETSNTAYGFKINYGKNYFPKKEYKGTVYKEGYYQSLVVTLGKGEGHNWWCILYPPLCLIEGNKMEDNNYKSFVKELISKYFK